VVNTNAALAPINIPVGRWRLRWLDHLWDDLDVGFRGGGGTSVPGQVQVYDSMGKAYEATVTYTKTGTTPGLTASHPDTLTANTSTARA